MWPIRRGQEHIEVSENPELWIHTSTGPEGKPCPEGVGHGNELEHRCRKKVRSRFREHSGRVRCGEEGRGWSILGDVWRSVDMRHSVIKV